MHHCDQCRALLWHLIPVSHHRPICQLRQYSASILHLCSRLSYKTKTLVRPTSMHTLSSRPTTALHLKFEKKEIASRGKYQIYRY